MEPFHVTCETCHARLIIRSESVIGQIHACPKCESMVQIAPPPGWAPAADANSAATPSSLADETTAAAANAASGQSLLVWGLGGAGLVSVMCLAGLVAWSGDESAPPPIQTAAATPRNETPRIPDATLLAESVEEESVEPLAEAQPAATQPAEPERAEPPAAETIGAPAVADALPELPAENAIAADEPAKAPPAVSAPPAAPVASDPPVQPSSPNKKTEPRQPVLTFDPLDFDPLELSLGNSTSSPSVPADGSPNGDRTAPPAEVGAATVDAPSDQPAQKVNLEPDGDPAVSVRVGPTTTVPQPPRIIAEQMALRIESFESRSVPVTRLVDVVAQMANVAITVDPLALEVTGVSPRATVKLSAHGTTLDALLRDALAQHRLSYVERDGQIILTQPAADRRRSVDYEVKDLLEPGAADASDIAELIKRTVAPRSWEAGESSIQVEGTKLRVDQITGVQSQILVFCERLRMARGLATRSRYPAAALAVELPYVKLGPVLQKTTTFTFLPWTRLADVIRHWESSAGVTILVDWGALASVELTPASPVAFAVIAKPWETALDAVLEPLGLAWWAANGETIQITSRAAICEIERIEFYPLSKELLDQFATTDTLVESLRKELLQTIDVVDSAAAASTHLEVDAPSGRLIVRGSPLTHRHLTNRLLNTSSPQADERIGTRTNATPIGAP